jgi:hypothetical protein
VAGLKIRLGKLAFSFLPLEQGFQTFLCIQCLVRMLGSWEFRFSFMPTNTRTAKNFVYNFREFTNSVSTADHPWALRVPHSSKVSVCEGVKLFSLGYILNTALSSQPSTAPHCLSDQVLAPESGV